MKPSIILLAPEPLLASWRMNLVSDPSRPLLSDDEVACIGSGSSVPELLGDGGENQLLVCLLGESTAKALAAVRASCPNLALAVAENPEAPAALSQNLWTDELVALADYRVVCDFSSRDGTSLYGAAKRFLMSLPRPR